MHGFVGLEKTEADLEEPLNIVNFVFINQEQDYVVVCFDLYVTVGNQHVAASYYCTNSNAIWQVDSIEAAPYYL